MKNTTSSIYFILSTIFIVQIVSAQDAHLSQYSSAQVLLNPATTGFIKNKYTKRAAINFRNQWASIGSKSTMMAMSYDLPVKDIWGAGGYLSYYDGGGVLNVVNIGISGSRTISLDGNGTKQQSSLSSDNKTANASKHHMSIGLQMGLIFKSTGQLSFNNQYNTELGFFNENVASGEAVNKFSQLNFDLNYGFMYSYNDHSAQFNPYGGLAIFHITTPKETFISNDKNYRLPRRWVFYGGTKIIDHEEMKGFIFVPNILLMLQGKATELNMGVETLIEINEDIDFQIDLNYRYKDAFIPAVGIHYKDFIYKIGYDFNVSKLKAFSKGKGAIELSVILLNK